MGDYIVVGQVLGAWGNKGELRVGSVTQFPQRFSAGSRLYLQGQPFTIERSRCHAGRWVLKLAGIEGREAAQGLRGRDLEIPRQEVPPLPPGSYYWFQVVGLQVRSTQGETLGQVAQILPTPANDVYLVRGPRGEFLVPAIEDVVRSIDLEQGTMLIEVMPGLLDFPRA